MRIHPYSRRPVHAAAACSLAALAVAVAPLGRLPPLVLYNRTPSVPVDWYMLVVGRTPRRGDPVAFMLPPAAWTYARRRGEQHPDRIRLLKRVLAAGGDRVSTAGGVLRVNGVVVGQVAAADEASRPLPRWRADRVLAAGELFVGSPVPRSFDGRYFGPIRAADVIGVYRPARTEVRSGDGD